MEKKEIIRVILDVRASHVVWVKQGKIILNGVNLDTLQEPAEYSECEFSHWCESNKSNVSAFSWFKELQKAHQKLHQSYSDLFFGSMRKYKPKTMNELMEDFEALESASTAFKQKLDEVESEVYQMSDVSFNNLVTKSLFYDEVESVNVSDVNVSKPIDIEDTLTPETKVLETKQQDDSQEMESVDINQYDSYQNPFHELESISTITEVKQTDSDKEKDKDKVEAEDLDAESAGDISAAVTDNKDVNPVKLSASSANRHVSLKEQSIIQLQQEKEFSKLELAHLEETQKLTQQSVEQLEQYYALKQQEIELEQLDNGGFIEFKANAKKQAEDELADIEEKKSTLKHDITDLAKQNVEDQLEQEEDQKEVSIEKQFEELKLNKAKNLKELQEHKEVRKKDLVELREQVLLLEEELSDMDQDIDIKQQAILDLEEKEQLKNEERSIQLIEQEKIQQERNASIIDMQKELDQLSDQEQIKRTELDTINFQVEELNKSNALILETNTEELKDLELQQEQKREKLLETEDSKSSKLAEIKDIDIRIADAERSLADLKSYQKEAEQTEKELETS